MIPSVYVLIRAVESANVSGLGTLKDELVQDVKERFGASKENQLFTTATLLDPRFKEKHVGSDAIDRLQMLLPDDQDGQADDPSQPPRPKKARPSVWDFEDEVPQHQNTSEVAKYLALPRIPRTSDPLAWWKAHGKEFPRLAEIARNFLACPPSSVESEWVFSASGFISSERRSRLTMENLEKLTFLKFNLTELGFQY